MPEREAVLPGASKRALSFSPSRTPVGASARIYGSGAALNSSGRRLPPDRLSSSPAAVTGPSARNPPEPLKRAVADCLSPPASHIHVNSASSAASAAEAAKTLRDYINNPSTVDMAYIVLIEHAFAERDRSPAVVPKCVALLKRYLIRYTPKLHVLRQIDIFCANSIARCESRQYGGQSATSNSFLPPPTSNFASSSLVKSLNYVRSLVARHIPKLSFHTMLSGASGTMRQPPRYVASFLNRTFTSQLNEVASSRDLVESEGSKSSSTRTLFPEKALADDNNKYIVFDIAKWRWHVNGEQQLSFIARGSNDFAMLQDLRMHEVCAASLLAGNEEANAGVQPSDSTILKDFSDIHLLQSSAGPAANSFASSHTHLKVITASKRMKTGADQVWMSVPITNFQLRPRPLFQYKHYSEQQPLKLNPFEVYEVIAEVCSDSPSLRAKPINAASRLSTQSQKPAADIAFSVLIKLVIDMYMMDTNSASPLTLYMLEGMLSSQKVSSRTRAFDLILNLAIHGQLLEPMFLEDGSLIERCEQSQESFPNSEINTNVVDQKTIEDERHQKTFSSIDTFESWLLVILFEVLLLLIQMEEREELVWASALSCLFYFVCDKGKIIRRRLHGLDIRVVKILLEISRENCWAEAVHCKLISMLTNMLYKVSDELEPAAVSDVPSFLVQQIDLLGGIDYICLEYSRASSREEKHDLFFVIFDYVVHQINKRCLNGGVSTYVYDDIQPLASLLLRTDAPEAFYITVKHGVEGIGSMLRSCLSSYLQPPEYEHLNMLLDEATRMFDATMSTFSRIDKEFAFMIQITKSSRSVNDVDGSLDPESAVQARLSWSTLHSLLHSENPAYRHHGFIWLVELLVLEIRDGPRSSVRSNIRNLQQLILLAGTQDSSFVDIPGIPLPIYILCSLLKSKHNIIRWGFLYVLEKFLMQCKLLLDEEEARHTRSLSRTVADQSQNRLDRAIAIIDILTSALSLLVQINETDHTNILKMCELLFSQLCLRLPLGDRMLVGNLGHLFSCKTTNWDGHIRSCSLRRELECKSSYRNDSPQLDASGPAVYNARLPTTSMAALLLRGHALAPMQLVARVPASLFYWPLIQLAVSATDDIALGVAVGSRGKGNFPGSTSDIRAALLLLLIGKCSMDQEAFQEVEGKEFFRGLLEDADSRVAYYSAAFLLKRMMSEEPETYQRMLQNLISKAQQTNNEKLLENPYLQMRGILLLSNDQ